MPESRKRKKASTQAHEAEVKLNQSWAENMKPSPRWWAPTSVIVMLLGLVVVVVYYVSEATLPIPGGDFWNLVLGLGVAFVGFLMLLRWK